jgi:osmoprotectant transport system substrate-binding protein
VRPRRACCAAVLLVLGALAACGSGPATPAAGDRGDRASIRVASYDFSENQILAAVYAEGMRRAGLPVSLLPDAGTREVVEPALEQGVVDVVIDYLGTALDFSQPDRTGGAGTPTNLDAALQQALGVRGVTVLTPATAEDQNGFAVTRAFARQHGVSQLSDLVPLAGGLTFGGPPECRQRPLCLPGLSSVYGLHFGRVQNMPSRGATVEALIAKDIDVGLLETTDARLARSPVVLLRDDRSLQPHENVVPLVRTPVLHRWGDRVRAALDGVSARLTTDELVQLNRFVEVGGLTPTEAAKRWWAG